MPSTKSASSGSPKADSVSKKVFDVSKPGTSAPSATAKPIIITHHPILRDPMVTGDTASEPTEPEVSAPILKPNREVVIAPVTATDTTTDSVSMEPAADSVPDDTNDLPQESGVVPKLETPSETKVTEEPPAPKQPDETLKEADTAAKLEETPAPSRDTSADTSPETDKGSSSSSDKTDDTPKAANDKQLSPEQQQAAEEEAAKAEAEHVAAIQKMVTTKQYFLPINSVEKRKTKHFVVAGVVIAVVLTVAWVDIALDAGLIRIGGLKAATHFFSR